MTATPEIAKAIFQLTTNSILDFSVNSHLKLDFRNSQDRLFAHAIAIFRIPDISELTISGFSEDDSDVHRFLINSFPSQISKFHFNTVQFKTIDTTNFIPQFILFGPSVLNRFYAHNLLMTEDQLVDILSAVKHGAEGIYLHRGKINETEDFIYTGGRLDGWKTKTLYFKHSGKDEYSGWESDISKLESIISILSGSDDLGVNLMVLGLTENRLDKDDVEGIMEAYGLSHMKVFV